MNPWNCILVMIVCTALVRILPIALMQSRTENVFIRSFLYYVPYVTLSIMTVPAIFEAAKSPLIGGLSFLVGTVAAWRGVNLFSIALACSATVFILELF